MKTIALIPTYQPSEALLETIDALASCGIETVVIDDGSGPDYLAVLERAHTQATVIGYGRNRGKGHAIKYGLGHVASAHGDDVVVVTVDDDGQHAASDALRCAREAAAHPGTLVLGRRDFSAPCVPARSRVGNLLARGLYQLTSGCAVTDTQTGLRAFSGSLFGWLAGVPGERYEYEMNVLLACPAEAVEIRELPIQTIYRDGNARSHFRTLRDSARVWGSLLRFCGASLASFCIDYLLFVLLVGVVGTPVANVCARVASATANFALNRSIVFRARESVGRQAVRYAAVALAILAVETLALVSLVGAIGMSALVAKPIVGLSCFTLSWVLQNRFVFRRVRQTGCERVVRPAAAYLQA